LKKENQEFKDEISRFKGEKGKPDIKGNNTDKKKKVVKLSQFNS